MRYFRRFGYCNRINGSVLATAFISVYAGSGMAAEPWTLNGAIGGGEVFSISGEQRFRYESLDGQFRQSSLGSDQILVSRTDINFALNVAGIRVDAEFMDSRQDLADRDSALTTASVNTAEWIQTSLSYSKDDLLGKGSHSYIRGGRITVDAGSRRLLARNRYRNTMNTFTGIDAGWESANGDFLQAFYLLPVTRLPSDIDSLLDNESETDIESSRVTFQGAFFSTARLFQNITTELYLYDLDEEDSRSAATADRDLLTTGFRVMRKSAPNAVDFDIEAAYQTGESSSSRNSEVLLDHRAWFAHGQVGYRWETPWSPQLALLFDYASGDKDPDDGENNRFDTLYGARRFDYGPTGIYGPFARSNLLSPGIRLAVKPSSKVDLMVTHRWYQLAEKRDAWTSASIQDATGQSGNDLGQQLEMRLRWSLIPKSVDLEFGAAYLFAGDFAERATGESQEDSVYSYAQVSVQF